MTDTNTTEETTTKVTFGFDASEILDTYRKERFEACRTFDEIESAARSKIDKIKDQMREALGWDSMADALTLAFYARAIERVNLNSYREARNDAIEAAKEKRDKALHADPFMKYVDTVVRDNYDSGMVDALLRKAPFTLDSLKKLANEAGWCQEFESVAKKAAQEDVIPATPTIKASTPVSYYDVPDKFGAEAGEDWVMDYEVPAYVRLTDEDGDSRYTGNFAIESTITYRRVDSDS